MFNLDEYPAVKDLFSSTKFQDAAKAVCPPDRQLLAPFQFNFIIQIPGQVCLLCILLPFMSRRTKKGKVSSAARGKDRSFQRCTKARLHTCCRERWRDRAAQVTPCGTSIKTRKAGAEHTRGSLGEKSVWKPFTAVGKKLNSAVSERRLGWSSGRLVTQPWPRPSFSPKWSEPPQRAS